MYLIQWLLDNTFYRSAQIFGTGKGLRRQFQYVTNNGHVEQDRVNCSFYYKVCRSFASPQMMYSITLPFR